MSNEVAIALIAASSFPGFLCYMYSSRLANAVSTGIVTGVIGGVPASLEYREFLLYQRWILLISPSLGISAGVAAINFKIARVAADPGVQTLAYLFVFGFGLVALGWALGGASEFAYYRRVLKRAARD